MASDLQVDIMMLGHAKAVISDPLKMLRETVREHNYCFTASDDSQCDKGFGDCRVYGHHIHQAIQALEQCEWALSQAEARCADLALKVARSRSFAGLEPSEHNIRKPE